MSERLLMLDCDGTLCRIRNPFLALARELSCYETIRDYTNSYLAGRISYEELVSLENPVFRIAAKYYATTKGYPKFDASVFSKVLGEITGSTLVSTPTVRFVDDLRSWGYQLAIISSGWDVMVSRAALETGIDYWRANKVLFTDGEFAGTRIEVNAHKTKEFALAVAHFVVDYKCVAYLGDNEFDLPGMEFIHEQGGDCLVYGDPSDRQGIAFPNYVKQFVSLDELRTYLRARQ